jgi:hypothetical protein
MKMKQHLPGDILEDGTIYIGIFNDGTKCYHISIEPKDEPSEMTWYEASRLEGCPTKDELQFITSMPEVCKLKRSYYWSSTESSTTVAWFFDFTDGYMFTYNKTNAFYVRQVRRTII